MQNSENSGQCFDLAVGLTLKVATGSVPGCHQDHPTVPKGLHTGPGNPFVGIAWPWEQKETYGAGSLTPSNEATRELLLFL